MNELAFAVEGGRFTPTFDTFVVNDSVARSLGKRPLERLASWATKTSTRSLALCRDGMSEICELASLGGETSACAVPPSPHYEHESFCERYLDWVLRWLDRQTIAWGRTTFPDGNLELPLFGFIPSSCSCRMGRTSLATNFNVAEIDATPRSWTGEGGRRRFVRPHARSRIDAGWRGPRAP